MPARSLRPCGQTSCRALVHPPVRFCPQHARAEVKRTSGWQRLAPQGSATERGYGTAWRRARLGFLAANPICVHCKAAGRLVPAVLVDHVRPHRGDMAIFWATADWAPLCRPCHSAKAMRENGLVPCDHRLLHRPGLCGLCGSSVAAEAARA